MFKVNLFTTTMACLLLIFFSLIFVHPLLQADQDQQTLVSRSLVRQLKLTDLCLFTEARYTRNPTQADLHSPFQDYPMSFEHFPSGSFLSPPTLQSETTNSQ